MFVSSSLPSFITSKQVVVIGRKVRRKRWKRKKSRQNTRHDKDTATVPFCLKREELHTQQPPYQGNEKNVLYHGSGTVVVYDHHHHNHRMNG
mmetsp:Transcript_19461/g.19792  ORF Transcript_19461/g.19792 Transcript_19461/m.19792 type:complete len:92 (-) Transcript_19461:482-757(-)